MNKEVKALWTKALRSGEYKQAKGALHRQNEGYCCLGVLCDVAVKAGAMPPPWTKGREGFTVRYGKTQEGAVLPEEVMDWAELSDNEGQYLDMGGDKHITLALSYQNDDGMSFADIADIIDREF